MAASRPPLGARRRRFVLERPLEEPDGFGGVLRRYVAGPVLWGALAPAGVVDRTGGGRTDARPVYRITLRGRPATPPWSSRPATRRARCSGCRGATIFP